MKKRKMTASSLSRWITSHANNMIKDRQNLLPVPYPGKLPNPPKFSALSDIDLRKTRVETRISGNWKGKAIYLDDRYRWILGIDNEGAQVAVPQHTHFELPGKTLSLNDPLPAHLTRVNTLIQNFKRGNYD